MLSISSESSTLEESNDNSMTEESLDISIEEAKPIEIVRIDPRQEISITEEHINSPRKMRPLNSIEVKKIQRITKEEPSIIENHPELIEQEKTIYEESLCDDLVVDYSPIIGLKTTPMEHQYYGISWMKNLEVSEGGLKGGILADEMGLGKTLQIIGLMLRGDKSDINLVVVPKVAISQWVYEMEKHAPGAFEILVRHGRTNKDQEKWEFSDKIKVVLTTYGTIESSFRRGTIQSMKYTRIILDEAHMIKDNKSGTARAINKIESKYRWGLTGTPVQNRVNDLLSLVKFLKIDPLSYYFCKRCDCKSMTWLRTDEVLKDETLKYGWCVCGHFSASHFSWWNRRITNPIRQLGYTDYNQEVFGRLKVLTSRFILRRTKNELEKSLGLPPKIVIVKRCLFSPQEREFYQSLYANIKAQFNSYHMKGQVLNNYAHIFELLQKMRMAVNHPFLTQKVKDEDAPICGFCNAEAEDPVKSKCNHVFCRGEAELFLQESNKCPVCHVPITIDLMAEMPIKSKNLISIDTWMSSTKIETIVELLGKKSEGKVAKSIIFSQFVNFLEILRWRLERAGFRCVKIYGSMTISQRKAAVDEFNSNPEITVFLISLKAGGVALNLTEAENVFIMDLWWNPAVEEQAMDRIHRIGQFRPIRVYRIIIEDSIESRILMLQKKKKALFETTIDNNIDALQRLSEEDLQFLFL